MSSNVANELLHNVISVPSTRLNPPFLERVWTHSVTKTPAHGQMSATSGLISQLHLALTSYLIDPISVALHYAKWTLAYYSSLFLSSYTTPSTPPPLSLSLFLLITQLLPGVGSESLSPLLMENQYESLSMDLYSFFLKQDSVNLL